MKKILAILLALSMLCAFAACGSKGGGETTTLEDTSITEDTEVTEDTEATEADSTEATEATDVTEATEATEATEKTTGKEEPSESETEEETKIDTANLTKEQFAEYINAETAKIVKSGSYKVDRTCEYTSPIDVGGATNLLNKLIQAIDKNANLDSVVGGFIGIGKKEANMPKDKKDLKSNYQMKATKLKAEDLGSFSGKNGVYTFTLANATDPQKTDATPLSRFTNDFITHDEVVKGVEEAISAIKVEKTTVNFKNIKVTVKVKDGKITNIDYSYDFDAVLNLKAGIKITGTGAAVTKGSYSNIKY